VLPRRATLFLLLVVTACATARIPFPASWPHREAPAAARADHAMVVSDSARATKVGVEIMRQGGNAVDGAVATAFALAVTYPEAGNLAGGGFAVIRMPSGERMALDFREVAPAAASRDMFLDADGKPTRDSLEGHRASGVPGSVAGLYALHQKYGKKPWREVVAPAIALARDGFPIEANTAEAIAANAERLARNKASAALFLPGSVPLAAGTVWRNPELAAVLERIAEQGPDGFYRGETATLLVTEMRQGGGLINESDLAGYQAKWREPIVFSYRGHEVLSMPPPSSGGIVIAMIAKILEGYDLRELGWHTPAHLQLLAEAERRAFADRNTYLADPDFIPWPPSLLSEAYITARRRTIVPGKATPSAEVKPGLGEPEHTTHLAVVDREGGAVALTTTINELFGSGITVTGGGFLLNNEMDDFTAKPGSPNLFGLVQGEANGIAPKKRMLSAMSPTIVLDRKGRPMLLAGGRGGSRIISGTFQVLSNVIDFGMDVRDAVAAPRIHMQHLPDKLFYEKDGVPEATRKALEAMGYALEAQQNIAASPALLRDGGEWTGSPDPRKGGGAAGY
jgi:gamma-glutamyltranspeptidase / glutathione hydrolase